MTRRQRVAVAVLFCVGFALTGGGYFWLSHQSSGSQAAQHREQAAQQRAGQQLEQKLCSAFGGIAELKPPAGSAAANPSRAYEQDLHAKLDQLGADLGCRIGDHR